MGIEPIRHGTAPLSPSPRPEQGAPAGKPAQPPETEADAVELSPEARQLQEAQRREHLERVRQRLHSGFYSRLEVLHQVAQRLLEELTPKR